ncbi:MAG: AMP-binding protein [Deltaproteobacteria bacterium]|nr:AMP-binding protein [Deltaproteobacteria bacterium]
MSGTAFEADWRPNPTIRSVPAALAAMARVRAGAPALRRRVAGTWRPISWSGWVEAACEIAAGLVSLGVRPGDRVALVGVESVGGALVELGAAWARAVSVPIPASAPPPEIEAMLRQVRAKALVVEPEGAARLVGLRHDASILMTAATDAAASSQEHTLASMRARGRAAMAADVLLRAAIVDAPSILGPDDPWSILFTSGTTGAPRGVVLSHGGAVYQGQAIAHAAALGPEDEQLLVLPLSQIYGRVVLCSAIAAGATTSFGSPKTLDRDLVELAPTAFAAVPELLERLAAGFRGELDRVGWARPAIERALETGRRVSALVQRGEGVPMALSLQHRLAQRVVFSRLRARLGGRLRYISCGGAPLRRELAEFFHATGVLVLEGYGLTEAGGVVACNRVDGYRFGTVGVPLPGCDVRLGDDGELFVRSPSLGHALDEAPEVTREADGFLATGDVAQLQHGMLRLVDRKRDIIKTQGGKRVAPQKLEAMLAGAAGIARAVVLGEGERELVALVDIDDRVMMEIARRENLGCRSRADLVEHPRIRQHVADAVAAVNDAVARHEAIAEFSLLPEPLQAFAGDLARGGAPRRDAIAARHAARIAGLRARLSAQAEANADAHAVGAGPAGRGAPATDPAKAGSEAREPRGGRKGA